MQINGFQVNEHGSGFELTVRIYVGREEPLGQRLTEDLGSYENILIPAFEGEVAPRTIEPEEAQARPTMRHRGSATSTAAADASSSPAGASAVPGSTPSNNAAPSPTPGRRRRRGAATTPTETSAAGGGAENPTDASAAGGGAENPTDAPAAEGRRARRGASASSAARTSMTKSPSDKVTDEDLTKACSQRRSEGVGVAAIMEMAGEFGAGGGNVAAIPPENRQEFLDRLKELK